jgi:allantoin racemase
VNTPARTPYDHLLAQIGYVDAAERAEAGGCDAILVDTFGDYGIAAMRAAITMPVVGAGEAGIASAAEPGPFSIVTVWPASMAFLYRERLANSIGGERCVRVHHISDETELDRYGTPEGIVARLSGREGTVVDRVAGAIRTAAAEDGVSHVLLGCTCMAPIAPLLASRLGDIGVVDASRAGLDAALELLRQGAGGEVTHRTPRAGAVIDLVDCYLGKGSDQAGATVAAEECEVCVSFMDDEVLSDETAPSASRTNV